MRRPGGRLPLPARLNDPERDPGRQQVAGDQDGGAGRRPDRERAGAALLDHEAGAKPRAAGPSIAPAASTIPVTSCGNGTAPGRTRPHLLVADDVPVLNAYPEVRPDLVLTDLQMPWLDGFGLVRALRERGERVPVILLTARDDALTRRTAAAVGVDGLLLKPFGLTELAARVRGALGSAAGRV